MEALERLPELDPAGPHGHPAQARAVPVDAPVREDEPRRVRVVRRGRRLLGGRRVGVLAGQEDGAVATGAAPVLAVGHLAGRTLTGLPNKKKKKKKMKGKMQDFFFFFGGVFFIFFFFRQLV